MEKFYGQYGGQFVDNKVLEALNDLEEAFLRYKDDSEFIKEYNYYLKQYVGSSGKLNIELPHDQAIPLLSIYSKKIKTLTWKYIPTLVFIEMLFYTYTQTHRQWYVNQP